MESITVEELIEILKKLPRTAKVGRVGHFGEFHPMDKHDFRLTRARLESMHNRIVGEEEVIAIEPPDIGPDPE